MEPSSTGLPQATFATSAITPSHRFEAWRSLLGLTHDVEAPPHDFDGWVTSTTIDRMVLREMTTSPQSVARSAQRVRADGLDHFVVHLTTEPFDFESGETRQHVAAGSITINALSRPFRRSLAAENGSIILSLSRDLLAEHLPDPEAFHGFVIENGTDSLLGTHLRNLAQHVHKIGSASAEGVARASAQLLAASLAPHSRAQHNAAAARGLAALARCKQFIDRHLHSPALSPDMICRDVEISRSALYRLFEHHDGVANYIRSRRLGAAHAALCARKGVRVSEVSCRFGFADLATFSRQFRAAYGVPPRDVIGRTKAVPGAVSDDVFTDWIRRLV